MNKLNWYTWSGFFCVAESETGARQRFSELLHFEPQGQIYLYQPPGSHSPKVDNGTPTETTPMALYDRQ